MEGRGYKRKFLESVVEERLKKIRNELFIIDIANNSEDSEEEDRNYEINEDGLNDDHDNNEMIELHVHDNEENDIYEWDNAIRNSTKNYEDAEKSNKENEKDEDNTGGIATTPILAIKEEPAEKFFVQRPIIATGDHMYCPIVISDHDFDFNIEEDGIEVVHVPHQLPEVVNLDSSDDEVSIIHVEHGSLKEKINQKSDDSDGEICDVEDKIVGDCCHESGEKFSISHETAGSDQEKMSHYQATESDKDGYQCTGLTNRECSDKESSQRMNNNYENTFKELTIPKALSVLGCKYYTKDLDQQREEESRPGYTGKVKKLPPPDYLGIINRKIDSNKIAENVYERNEPYVQIKNKQDGIDEIEVSKSLAKTSSDHLYCIKDFFKRDGKSEDPRDFDTSTNLHDVGDKGQKNSVDASKENGKEQDKFVYTNEDDQGDKSESTNNVEDNQVICGCDPNKDYRGHDKSRCTLNEDEEMEKESNSDKTDLASESINSMHDVHQMDHSTNKGMDSVSTILSKERGETFKYQDETYIVISSSESEVEELNNVTCRNKVRKIHKTHKLKEIDGDQLSKIKPANDDKDDDKDNDKVSDKTRSQSDCSCTSSEATINASIVIIDEETCSEYEFEEDPGLRAPETFKAVKSTLEEKTLDNIKGLCNVDVNVLNEGEENKSVNFIKGLDIENEISKSATLDKENTEHSIERSVEKIDEQVKGNNMNVLHVNNIEESEAIASINKKATEATGNSFNENETLKMFNNTHKRTEAKFIRTSAQNSENIVHPYVAKEGICNTSTKSSSDDILEVNCESEELLTLEKDDKALDNSFKKQKHNDSKDESTVLKLPSVRNLSPGERLRTRSSKCYSPIRYISNASTVDEQGDYFSSAYQRFEANETEEQWCEEDNSFNHSSNYVCDVNEEGKQSVFERLGLNSNYTLAVTFHHHNSETKENKSNDDTPLTGITPVKRVVVMKPNICEDGKDIEKYDIENKKPSSEEYNNMRVPQKTLFPIPVAKTVRASSVQHNNVKKVFEKRSFPSCIVPLKEVHLSDTGNNSKAAEASVLGDRNNKSKGQEKLEIKPDKSQTSKWSNFAVSTRNSDDLLGKMSNPDPSGSKIDSLRHYSSKQKDITNTHDEHQRTKKALTLCSIHPRQEPIRDEDGELTPCKILMEFKIKGKWFIRCDDCGHECWKRESMVRHFKYTFHKSASHYEWIVSGLFDRKKDFVINKFRPFNNEVVHICPISRCEHVFLCRADCITHYQSYHMKSDMVYCTARIQKEELCNIRCFYSMLECKICGNIFADGINLDYHIQNSLHQLYHKYEGMFIIFVCHGCHKYFTSFIPAVDHKCFKKNSAYRALRLLHVSKQSQEMWVIDNGSKLTVSKVEGRNEIVS